MADPIYRIHPAIGVARVGDADRSTYFIGPEFPDFGPAGPPSMSTFNYKSGGLIRPQAARFRIFEYVENAKGELSPSREINLSTKECESTKWTVHLANRKASFFKFVYLHGELYPPAGRRNPTVIARRKLEIDPLARSISGRNLGPVEFRKGTSSNPTSELWPDPAPSPPIEYLGELRTDDGGRLLVIGGYGKASGIAGKLIGKPDLFNSEGWFDDVSDGPVTAEVVMKVGPGKKRTFKAQGAWLLCGPPDFAPGLTNLVTLYDLLYDMAARQLALTANETIYDTILKPLWDANQDFGNNRGLKLTSYKPDFDQEIYPLLVRALKHAYVFEPLKAAHVTFRDFAKLGDPSAAQAAYRRSIFNFFRKPETVGRPAGTMPKLHGDEWSDGASRFQTLTVTRTQYAMLERWADGQFVKTAGKYPPDRSKWHDDVTPAGLDRAALEHCVGGAFAPGIEVGWQIRNPALFSDPFRIDHSATSKYLGEVGVKLGAGHFSRQMSLPWHTDFLACTITTPERYGWWPTQRPDIAYLSASDFMARNTPTSTTRPPQAWTRADAASWPAGGSGPTQAEFAEHFCKLGIVRPDPEPINLERERNSSVP